MFYTFCKISNQSSAQIKLLILLWLIIWSCDKLGIIYLTMNMLFAWFKSCSRWKKHDFFFFFNDDILVTVRTVSLSPDTRMILNRDNVIVYLINIVGLQVNDVEDGKYSKRLKDVPWYLVLRFHCEVLKQLLNYHYNIICMAWKQLFVKETCWSFVNRDSILTSPVIKFNLINFISYKINKTCDTWKKKINLDIFIHCF